MSIHPLYDQVVVAPNETETKTAGGILIPDTADKDKPMYGTVEYVGNGRLVEGKMVPLQVKKGDKVLFGKYAGTNIKLQGKEYLVMKEESILAIVD